MTNPSGMQLPPHVAQYLKDCGVDPVDLPEDVLATYASLTSDEIKVLRKTGDVLKKDKVDAAMAARIH
jgi:hypothetical protein